MTTGNNPFESASRTTPAEVLRQFSVIFTDKGWLNQTIRIKYREKVYSIMCSEKTFIAYRVNKNWGVSPGIPGWPVCIIDQDQIIEDPRTASISEDDPDALSWLNCITNNDYEAV